MVKNVPFQINVLYLIWWSLSISPRGKTPCLGYFPYKINTCHCAFFAVGLHILLDMRKRFLKPPCLKLDYQKSMIFINGLIVYFAKTFMRCLRGLGHGQLVPVWRGSQVYHHYQRKMKKGKCWEQQWRSNRKKII